MLVFLAPMPVPLARLPLSVILVLIIPLVIRLKTAPVLLDSMTLVLLFALSALLFARPVTPHPLALHASLRTTEPL
jgi:hypothetical protein